MAVIGFIRQEVMEINDNGEKKEVKWLEAHFRVAGLRPFKAKFSKNKNKKSDNSPDFFLYLRGNINKGDSFRDIKIGSFWLKQKSENGVTESYMTGNIEIAFKNVRCLIKRPDKLYEDEKIGFLYEIIAFTDDNNNYQKQNTEYSDAYEPPYEVSETEINEEDIPF